MIDAVGDDIGEATGDALGVGDAVGDDVGEALGIGEAVGSGGLLHAATAIAAVKTIR